MAESTERITILLELEKEKFERNARTASAAVDRLERKFNPLAAAENKLKRQQEQLNAALKAGTLEAGRHARGMDLLQRDFDETAARINGARSNVVAMNGAVASQTGFMQRNRSVFQQAGYQVGDFAVQVQGGTSALTAFTQQGSQLLGVFGAYGAIAGAALAVGAPLIGAFLSAGENAATYGDAVESLEKSLMAYKEAADLAALSTEDLTDKYGAGAEILRGQLAILRELELIQTLKDAQAAAAAFSAEFSNIFAALDNQNAGFFSTFDIAGVTMAREEAVRLRDAIDAIGDADGPAQVSAAAIDLNSVLVETLGPLEKMPEEFQNVAREAADAAVKSQALQGTIDDTRVTAIEMVDAMAGAVGALGGAIPNADALLGRMRALATAAWDYAGALGASAYKGGRGGDPRKFGGSAKDIQRSDFGAQLAYSRGGQGNRITPKATRSSGGSGRSRGSGGRAQVPLLEIADKELVNIQRQIELLGKSKAEIAALTTKHKLLDEAKKRGIKITDDLTAKIDAEAAEVGQLAEKYDQARDKIAAMEQIQSSFEDSVVNAAMGGADAMDQFKDSIKRAALEYALFGSGLFAGGGPAKKGGFGGLLGGLGGIFAGFFDKGGTIPSGQFGIAAEKRDEFVNGTLVRGPAKITGGAETARMMRSGKASKSSVTNINYNIDARGAVEGTADMIARKLQEATPSIQQGATEQTLQRMSEDKGGWS